MSLLITWPGHDPTVVVEQTAAARAVREKFFTSTPTATTTRCGS